MYDDIGNRENVLYIFVQQTIWNFIQIQSVRVKTCHEDLARFCDATCKKIIYIYAKNFFVVLITRN